jgi:uncharacterized membrane protein YphA (DoxX/SURF4 family)
MTTTASAPSKGKTIGYWVTTGLIGLAFLTGGAGDLAGGADMVAAITHLGYPAYLLTILGVAKLLGAVAVLVPRFPRLKEWAYAGIVIDLLGASASHAFTGDGAGQGHSAARAHRDRDGLLGPPPREPPAPVSRGLNRARRAEERSERQGALALAPSASDTRRPISRPSASPALQSKR